MSSYHYPKPEREEITPKALFLSRRQIMKQMIGGIGAGIGEGALFPSFAQAADEEAGKAGNGAKAGVTTLQTHKGPYSSLLTPTPRDDVSHYNNFYEFGLDKSDPSSQSSAYQPFPWVLEITGLVKKPLRLDVADLLHHPDLEERVYRMRCVEAWSMVIPWDGLPLHRLIEQAEPDPKARFVAFESVVRPSEMPGQRSDLSGISWPYREGLRLDEAMHPLTLLALGVYGEALPKANGSPLRLVVPWKYGFKGIKAIKRIHLVEEQPTCTWNQLAPEEYGFYANVNPDVDHPRWSQAQERVIGSHSLFGEKRQPTLPFNGYGEQVAGLYKGMDLRANF